MGKNKNTAAPAPTPATAAEVRGWCKSHADLFPADVLAKLNADKGRLPAHAIQVFEFQNPGTKYVAGKSAPASRTASVPVPARAKDGSVTITPTDLPLSEVRSIAADIGLSVPTKGRVSADTLAAVGASLMA